MALKATNYWRSMIARLGSNRPFVTATSHKMKAFTPTFDASHSAQSNPRALATKVEFVPICMAVGMVVVAVTIATHTAKQQLLHSPTVNVKKKKRETMPEVDDPDAVISSADKFVNKSFLRKVAHIRDNKTTLPDPVRPNPFTRPRNAETLKTVGVDPSRHV